MRRRSSSMRSSVRATSRPPHVGEHAELLVLAHAVERERGHLARVVDREDEVRGVARRAARVGQRALVDQDQVASSPAGPGGATRLLPTMPAPITTARARDRQSARCSGWSSTGSPRGSETGGSLIYHTGALGAGAAAARSFDIEVGGRRGAPRGAVRGLRRARPARRGHEPPVRRRRRERPDQRDDHRLLRHPARPRAGLLHLPRLLPLPRRRAAGDHARLDVWPRRKEVVVADDPSRSSRRSTTAASPASWWRTARPASRARARGARQRPRPHRRPASPTRRPGGWRARRCPDREQRVTEGYVEAILEPEARMARLRAQGGEDERARATRSRAARARWTPRAAPPEAQLARRELVEDGVPVETYRRIDLDEALAPARGRPAHPRARN